MTYLLAIDALRFYTVTSLERSVNNLKRSRKMNTQEANSKSRPSQTTDYARVFPRDPDTVCLMARKPSDFRNLKEQVDRAITPSEAKNLIGKSKVLTGEFADWEACTAADFSAGQWWKIKLKKERVELLVNTEGYSYARYAGILQSA